MRLPDDFADAEHASLVRQRVYVERYGSSAYASWDERTTEELRGVYDGLNDIIGKENGD
jgi:hypothetical protein